MGQEKETNLMERTQDNMLNLLAASGVKVKIPTTVWHGQFLHDFLHNLSIDNSQR